MNRRQRLADEARRILDAHGLTQWTFRWSRSVGNFGATHFDTGAIHISWPLVRRNDDDKFHDTLLHEIAHVQAGHRAGHGPEWQDQALALGIEPVTCYTRDEITTVPHRWIADCSACGHRHGCMRRSRSRREGHTFCACGPQGDRLVWRRNPQFDQEGL